MTISKEQELKLLLKKDTYQILLQNSELKNELIQTNYYFDTPNLILEQNGMTLRIRQENDKWLLCLKVKNPANDINSYTSSLEFEQLITYETLNICTNNPVAINNWIPKEGRGYINDFINNLRLLGSIKNTRYSVKLFNDIFHTYDLDHSIFPNGNEAYELEVEGIKDENDSKEIMDEFKKLKLDFIINNKSKYKRFVEYLNEN